MRHRNKVNSLGRTKEHRKAMLANMASSLILRKRIYTTLAKAKALRSFVEPLITRSKHDTTHSRRTVFRYLQNKLAVNELFREISKKIADRPGGYTRILKTGFRQGDKAEMCFIELVDFNNTYIEATTKEKKVRRRRGKKKSSEEINVQPVKQSEQTQDSLESQSTEINETLDEKSSDSSLSSEDNK